jgi:hypothetical protein
MDRSLLVLSLSFLFSPACREDEVCEDRLDNDCNGSCECPAEERCRQFSSKIGLSGSNACFSRCTQQSDCPESTSCIEIRSGAALEPTIVGQCWPTCASTNECRGSTSCQQTKFYLGGADTRACF